MLPTSLQSVLRLSALAIVLFTVVWAQVGAASMESIPATSTVPMPVLRGGRDLLIARVGQEFFDRCLSLDSARCQWSRGRWRLSYRLRVPDAPWVSQEVWFDIDSTGAPVPSGAVHGVSDCVQHPELCVFFFNAGNAKDFARIAGLGRGIGTLRANLEWLGSHPLPRYAWVVTNTTVDVPGHVGGESMLIDPASGQVIPAFGRRTGKWGRWHCYSPARIDTRSGRGRWWR